MPRSAVDNTFDVDAAVQYVAEALGAVADPQGAVAMAAYMKTDMPFYGVKKAGRTPILRELNRGWIPRDHAQYTALVEALWQRPHREEKYLAIGVAQHHRNFIIPESLPLYRHLIVDGAWWDFVDAVAAHLVGGVLLRDRRPTSQLMRSWIDHDDMWLRRSAIICQLNHKADTDAEMLFEFCEARAHETGFFIRKAIGWALRQHARTDPDAVRGFLDQMGDRLSGLSRREATKHL